MLLFNLQDIDGAGTIKYFPESGFPFKYYPANYTREYLAPMVMIQIPIDVHQTTIGIECKAWAGNTDSSYFKSYFEIFIE